MNVISVPTIMICTFIAMAAISLAMTIVWFHNRRETAAGLWALAFIIGASGAMTIAVKGGASSINVIVSSALIAMAYTLFWAGYRAFNGWRTYTWLAAAVPAIQVMASIVWPQLREEPNFTVALQSTIIAVLSAASAYTVYSGPGNRKLAMSTPLAAFLCIHSIFHLTHIGYALFDPSPIIGGRMTAPWWKIFMLENFLNIIVVATSCTILIKERSEERHRMAAETDALTGIANRRAFVQQTEKLLPHAEEHAVLAILDIDHFKPINDRFGHQAGDRALIELARSITGKLPENTLFGRIGGEEFAIFLPGQQSDPTGLLEALRRSVEEIDLKHNGHSIPLTVSVGAAKVLQAGRNFDHLVAAADCALYAAKDSGRNRLVHFSPSQRLQKIIEEDGEKRIGLAENRISRRSQRSHQTIKAS